MAITTLDERENKEMRHSLQYFISSYSPLARTPYE